MKKLFEYNRVGFMVNEKGLKKKWVSERLGITPQAFSAICANRSQPSLNRLFQIADIIDCEVSELIGDGSELK